MRPSALTLIAIVVVAALAGCQPDPADAPPVGDSAGTVAAAVAAPVEEVSDATRQADFRLALFDARARLESAWADCAAEDRGCRDRALTDYDATMAEASREHGLEADDVVQLQPPPPAAGGSAPLVQYGGSRG